MRVSKQDYLVWNTRGGQAETGGIGVVKSRRWTSRGELILEMRGSGKVRIAWPVAYERVNGDFLGALLNRIYKSATVRAPMSQSFWASSSTACEAGICSKQLLLSCAEW